MTIILDRIVILRALISNTKQVGCLATRISACVQEDVGELSMAEVSAEHKCKTTDKDLAWRKALNCNP